MNLWSRDQPSRPVLRHIGLRYVFNHILYGVKSSNDTVRFESRGGFCGVYFQGICLPCSLRCFPSNVESATHHASKVFSSLRSYAMIQIYLEILIVFVSPSVFIDACSMPTDDFNKLTNRPNDEIYEIYYPIQHYEVAKMQPYRGEQTFAIVGIRAPRP